MTEPSDTDVNGSSIVCCLRSWSVSSDIVVPDGFNVLTVPGVQAHVRAHACQDMHARECVWRQIAFNPVSSGYRTHDVQLGSKCLYQPSPLTGPPPDISLNLAINDNKSKFKIPSIQLGIAF